MRTFVTLVKYLIVGLLLLTIGGYTIYNSDWFQKKYLYPFTYREIIYRYALQREMDPLLIASVVRTESKFNPHARSPKGALGLMQMMPETAKWIAEQTHDNNFTVSNLENPEINIAMGTWYLASLKEEFHGNEVLMLAAYNGGRGNVKQWMRQYGWNMSFNNIEQIPYRETREYVTRVLSSKERYQALYGR